IPAAARMRPSRMHPAPPTGPSVRAIAPRAPRANKSDRVAAIAATGIAQTASRRAAPGIFRVSSMATGITAAARSPNRKASQARRRECEAEIRVRQLPPQSLAGAEEDLFVVVRELRQLVERVPLRVLRNLRIHPTRHQPEKGSRELAPRGIA